METRRVSEDGFGCSSLTRRVSIVSCNFSRCTCRGSAPLPQTFRLRPMQFRLKAISHPTRVAARQFLTALGFKPRSYSHESLNRGAIASASWKPDASARTDSAVPRSRVGFPLSPAISHDALAADRHHLPQTFSLRPIHFSLNATATPWDELLVERWFRIRRS